MPISLELLQDIFDRSLAEFLRDEADGLVNGVAERNSCGRLAMPLERLATQAGLSGYFAEVEYNRKQGGQIKTILEDDMKVVNINCDLILHSRGSNIAEDNLIAVEMKKVEQPSHEKQAEGTA